MPEISLTERQESLFQHLESVYTMAQAISADADQAARLVEATYIQAFVMHPPGHTNQDDRRWLLGLLMQIHREQAAFDTLADDDALVSAASPEALHTLRPLRSRLAQQIVDRSLPAVLATLPDDLRLALLLCDAEGLSCAEAALVLDVDAETACRWLEQARTAVREALLADASDQERLLLNRDLPDGWLRHTLRRTVETAFDLPPSSLREAVIAATQAQPLQADLPPPLPASTAQSSDRPAHAERAEEVRLKQQTRPYLRRLAAVLLLITGVGALGYLASRSTDQTPETNLITLSVQQADQLHPTLATSSPGEAEEYVRTTMDRRLTLPTIDRAALTGVTLHEIAPGATVPVFLYEDTFAGDDALQITLYVFNYALLDQFEDRLQLERAIKQQIQDDQRFDLHDLGARNVLVWRNRDDIYIAVTPGNPETLRERIVFPS